MKTKTYEIKCTITVTEEDIREFFDIPNNQPIKECLWKETAKDLFEMDLNTEYSEIREIPTLNKEKLIMVDKIKKYVMTICYDDINAGYATRTEFYTSNDYSELENLYRYSKIFENGCCGCSVRNSNGKLLFGYEGKNKFHNS